MLAIDGKPIESHQIGAGLAVFSFDNHHFQTVIISLKVSTGAGQSPARKRLGMHPGRRCGSILRWRNGPRMAIMIMIMIWVFPKIGVAPFFIHFSLGFLLRHLFFLIWQSLIDKNLAKKSALGIRGLIFDPFFDPHNGWF